MAAALLVRLTFFGLSLLALVLQEGLIANIYMLLLPIYLYAVD